MTGMMKNKPGPLTPLEPARPVHRQSVGQGDAGVADIDATFELKSVNAKGLDIRLRMPAPFDRAEGEARARLAKALARGTASSRCDARKRGGLRHTDFQAAATTSCHVLIAAVRSTRCD